MPFRAPPRLTNADEYRHARPKAADGLLYGDTLWVSVVDPTAGRAEPRVVASFPTVLTNDAGAAREKISAVLGMYGNLPSYRAMLEREGVVGPGDIAVVGDEKTLDSALDRLRDIGVTDFDATIISADDGADARTLDYLQSRL